MTQRNKYFCAHTLALTKCKTIYIVHHRNMIFYKTIISQSIYKYVIKETCIIHLKKNCLKRPGPEVIKLFPCSTQLSMKFILLINVKMPTIVGILTFISIVNTSERFKAINFFICQYFSYYEQLKFRAQLSLA